VDRLTGGAARSSVVEVALRCTAVGEISASGWTVPVKATIVSGFRGPGGHSTTASTWPWPKGTVVHAAAVRRRARRDVQCPPGRVGIQLRSRRRHLHYRVRWYVDILHAGNVITRYCHMVQRPSVVVGEAVTAGQQIGLSGSSGNSSGPHVHFEVHINGDSGSSGAVDPVPFMAQAARHCQDHGHDPGHSAVADRPVPASQVTVLRGRRVIVGVPGLGWRADLRADDPVVHGSRTYVPVLTEQDYYRAETEQLEVFAPLVPVDRVWVEETSDRATGGGPVTLDAPPRRAATPIAEATTVTGRRVVQAVPDGHIRDLRAVTEVYRNADGVACVRVCGEPEWYRWALDGTTPSTSEIAATLVFLE
jgi:hypothetical protein